MNIVWLFSSHEWSKQNFSLQFQYNIKQTSDENKEEYQLEDYKLIQYQIFKINSIRIVRQKDRGSERFKRADVDLSLSVKFLLVQAEE